MAAEQQNKTVPIGWISPDKSCRIPPRIGPTPLACVGGVLFPPRLNMVRFVGQPAAAHLPVYNKELKGRQNEQLRQHQYCPMFQPLTFRDLGSVVIANVPKSPIDLSLFRLVRPAGAYAFPPPAVDNNPESCRVKREPTNRDECCSSKAAVGACSCDTDGCFGCNGSKFAGEGESTEKELHGESGDELSTISTSARRRGSPVESHLLSDGRPCAAESTFGEVGSDRAWDNEEERLVEDGLSTASALDVETPDKSPPPLLSSSAILTESASEDDERLQSTSARSPRRKRPRKVWKSSRSSLAQSQSISAASDDGIADDAQLFNLLRDLDDRSEADMSDVLRSPVAPSAIEFVGDKSPEAGGVGKSDDLDMDEMSEKKILRNATDERVVAKLYGAQPLTRDRVQLIGQMPVAELNSLIQQANLTEAEASLIRDIRRRSKNKVAARNCRKRKLDTISQLEVEVNELNAKRARLEQERDRVRTEALRYKQCVHALRRFIVKSLRKEAAAALVNASPSGGQLLDSDGISEFVSAMSNSANLSGSQADLFTQTSFPFESSSTKPDGMSNLSPLTEESPAVSLPLDLVQPSSTSDATAGLNRYASVSSLTTEPPQYSSSVNPDLVACSPPMPTMARAPFSAMPMVPGDMDTLAALLPPQPTFPQAGGAPVGINMPFSSWNTAALYF